MIALEMTDLVKLQDAVAVPAHAYLSSDGIMTLLQEAMPPRVVDRPISGIGHPIMRIGRRLILVVAAV